MEGASSFTARRSAASQLPTFQLPRPAHIDQRQYPAYAPSNTNGGPTPALASSVLTPPAGLQQPSELSSPMASSVNSGSSISSSASGPPYSNVGFWPTPSSYTYSSAPSIPPAYAGPANYIQGRPPTMYSPMYSPHRNTTSPAGGEGLPTPAYELPSFPGASPMSGGGHHQSHPQQQAQQHQQAQQQDQTQQQSQQHHQMNHPSHQTSQAPPPGPLQAPDMRPPHSYYTPASTPQQSSFPAYAQQSPTQHSPQTSSAPSNRISPVASQHSHLPQQNQGPPMAAPAYRPPFGPPGSYNLPAMASHHGPIMTNMHAPGSQMSLVGNPNMQYQHPHLSGPMYGHHQNGPQAQQTDRPFKCESCPQGFNRNHDLKRHRRIHLAVKPFPCGHCDKTFSRKDALKRHVLVKGCGKGGATNASKSPTEKDEAMSDSPSDSSPDMSRKKI